MLIPGRYGERRSAGVYNSGLTRLDSRYAGIRRQLITHYSSLQHTIPQEFLTCGDSTSSCILGLGWIHMHVITLYFWVFDWPTCMHVITLCHRLLYVSTTQTNKVLKNHIINFI